MFQLHHQAWLSAHPDRSEEWLEAVLSQGFDIHHINGDHNDNHPSNLILVEHSDHMRILHKGVPLRIKRPNAPIDTESLTAWSDRFISKGKAAYELRRETNMTWLEIGTKLGLRTGKLEDGHFSGRVINLAKSYAKRHNLTWPLEPWNESPKDPDEVIARTY